MLLQKQLKDVELKCITWRRKKGRIFSVVTRWWMRIQTQGLFPHLPWGNRPCVPECVTSSSPSEQMLWLLTAPLPPYRPHFWGPETDVFLLRDKIRKHSVDFVLNYVSPFLLLCLVYTHGFQNKSFSRSQIEKFRVFICTLQSAVLVIVFSVFTLCMWNLRVNNTADCSFT